MAFKLTPEKWAAIAYLAPAVAVGGIWFILLFVGNPPNYEVSDMLHHVFVEAPERALFWWLAALPVICVVLSIAYTSRVPQLRRGALVLCGVGVVLAVATWLTVDWTIAFFATLPLLFTVPVAKCHLTTRWSGP